MRGIKTFAVATFCAAPVYADGPVVVSDIAPIHALVSAVMGDLGEAKVLVPAGASPHYYAMRPSQAAALENADAVFWIGEGLTPWLSGPLETIATDAAVIELLELPATIRLDNRESAIFGEEGHHDHDDHDDHADHDDHDDHADHDDHDDHAGHDDHDDHAGHDHGAHDPHAWLDPRNAAAWVHEIEETLISLDPDNAATYEANAEAAITRLNALEDDLHAILEPVHMIPYVVYHNAYQYFENRFELNAIAAVADSEAKDPSPSHLAEVKHLVEENAVTCGFAEPQYRDNVLRVVFEGSTATIGRLDPIGPADQSGLEGYIDMMTGLATELESCLSGQ